MAQTTNNPLSKHFRQPSLYIKLTSNGKFWKDDSLDLPANGEIPVYPMTAKDEIMLKTPDALLNGTSVVNVVQSCCPNIKDAWQMPSVDVDSTLIAIRIASYGQIMSITSKCPSCNEEHEYDVDLQNVLSQIKLPNYNESITTADGLSIKFKPLTYEQVSKIGNMSFEEEKLIQSLLNTNVDDDVRKVQYQKHINNMIEMNNNNITNYTASITADGIEVSDPKFISEYYQNTDSSTIHQINEKIKEFAEQLAIKPVDTLCTSCQKEFKINIEFDYSSFFAKGF